MAHELSGLMKWLRRDEWRGPFEEVLDQHLGPACAKADIDHDELASLIGAERFMNLWGCAFEDFLTRNLEDGRNIVDDYLKRRGWNETAANKTYMTALRSSVMSLYEVSDIVLGESFLARDLIRGGEPVRVSERSATQFLSPWDRIAARVVQVRQKVVMGGGVLLLDRETSETVLKMIRRVVTKTRKEAEKLAGELGIKADELPADATDETAVLRAAAPSFSAAWLNDALQKVLDPPIPEMRNSDDEELLFCTVRYPLKPHARDEDIRAVLAAIPAFRPETDTFWNWVEEEQEPSIGKELSETSAAGRRFVTLMDDGAIVMGNIELKNETLTLSVNSRGRAERGQALIAPALSGLVGPPLTEMQTIEQMMESSDGSAAPSSGLSGEEERAIIHETIERHYTKMLDEPIPMLGDKTPREAAKTLAGRNRLVEWLKLLENHTAKRPASDPLGSYDFTWLWETLGVSDLRR